MGNYGVYAHDRVRDAITGARAEEVRTEEDYKRVLEKRSEPKEVVMTTINGVNVDQLVSTIDAVEENPGLAEFKFRAKTEWIEGAHTRTAIQGFYGAGEEDTSRAEPFYLEGDEPPVLLGNDAGPNAVETVLHALSSCLAVGFIYNAAARGIRVDALDFELVGELDLHAFLGLSGEERAGYKGIELTYRVESDAPREKIVELCEYVQSTSPVVDILRNAVPVSVRLAEARVKAKA